MRCSVRLRWRLPIRAAAAACGRHYPQTQQQSGCRERRKFGEMDAAADYFGDGHHESKRRAYPYRVYSDDYSAAFAGV